MKDNMMYKNISLVFLFAISIVSSAIVAKVSPADCGKQYSIGILLGSTREGRSSESIGKAIQKFIGKNSAFKSTIIDLRDFNLPFLKDAETPASRKTITDPVIKKWSDAVKSYDAFIVVVPEYNGSYTAVIKNAFDNLYPEWTNKPVAFVGYSGGPDGGINAVNHLRAVTKSLKMRPVTTDILIPSSWKAFDKKGALVDQAVEHKVNDILHELQSALLK
jgi:NAD(P)H-dependent FMN reductase